MGFKKLIIVIAFCFLSFSLFSASDVDSLQHALVRLKQTDTLRIDVLNKLAFKLKFTAPDNALKYAREAETLSNNLHYDKGLGYAYNQQGIIYSIINKRDSGNFYYNQALEIALRKHDNKGIARTYLNISINYQTDGNYELAVKYALKSASIMEKYPASEYLANIYGTIGANYLKLSGNYKSAIEYYKKAIVISKKNRPLLAALYNDIGSAYMARYNSDNNIKDVDSNISYLNLSLYLHDSLGDVAEIALPLENLGTAYLGLGQYDKALSYYLKAEKIIITTKYFNDYYGLLANIAATYRKKGQYEKAIEYLDRDMAMVKKLGGIENIESIYHEYSVCYEKMKKYDKALEYEKLYEHVKDSLMNKEKSDKILELQTKYETDKKESQIQLLNKDKALQEAKINRERAANYGLAGSAVLFLLMAGSLFVAYNQKKKNNSILQSQKEILQKQKDEIEKHDNEMAILLEELHHRVKNNLQVVSSMLSLQSNQMEDSTAVEAFREGKNRVEAMALIHQRLYKNEDSLSTIDMQEYIRSLVETVSNSYGYSHNKLHLNLEALELDVEIAVPIGLILNEVLSNCFKHAFASLDSARLEVVLQKKPENVFYLKVSDNGIGLPADAIEGKNNSFGMKMIHSLINQLRGSLTILTEEGTLFEFIVPVNKKTA